MIPAMVPAGSTPVEMLLAAPSPSDGQEFTPVSVSPGLEGFFFTFILAALLVLLLVDMARRVRRVQAAARVKERYEGQDPREVDQASPSEDPGAVTGSDQTLDASQNLDAGQAADVGQTPDAGQATDVDQAPDAGQARPEQPGVQGEPGPHDEPGRRGLS